MIIEEGKYYRRRDGFIAGPAEVFELPNTRFPWLLRVGETKYRYTDTGRAYYTPQAGPLQLIEEVTKPENS